MRIEKSNSYEEGLAALAERVEEKMRQLLGDSLEESLFTQKEKKQRSLLKAELRTYLYLSGTGNREAKIQVKGMIRDILTEEEKITKEQMDRFFPFHTPSELCAMHQFQLLLFKEEQIEGADGFSTLLQKAGWAVKENRISSEEVKGIYLSWLPRFDFLEKLEFLTQLIYSMLYGLGSIDSLLEQRVDGISGGVSSGGEKETSIWVQWMGRSIHLACLKFGSKEELIRVCRRICRFEQAAQFTSEKGYLVCELADGSRVVVTRPPFSESWSFFVRKFDTIEKRELEYLIRGENAQLPIGMLQGLIAAQTTLAVTGEQGSGKTTLLVALIGCISPELNLRIQEMNFEMHIRKYYPDRNCLTFRETASVSTQQGLDLQKKTDGSVNILSEVATHEAGSYMIQMGMTASLFTMFTHHATTTENLIYALRNSLLICGQFGREEAATQQVTEVIQFDIHLVKDRSGKRYIERITEICPSVKKDGCFIVRDIIYWNSELEKYQLVKSLSEQQLNRIKKNMTKEEWIKWQNWYGEQKNETGNFMQAVYSF